MNLQEYRNLQEAYLGVYDELDESAAGNVADYARKLANQKKGQTPERKKMYQDLEYKARSRDKYGDGSPNKKRSERTGTDRGISPRKSQERSTDYDIGGSTYTASQKERLPKSKEKYRRQVATGVRDVSAQERKRLGVKGVSRYNVQPLQGVKDSYEYDLYDVILEYLLDEGYAETPEAAERIMVNMSEDWRDGILSEAYVEFTKDRKDSLGRPKLSPRGKLVTKLAKKELGNILAPHHRDAKKQKERSEKMKSVRDTYSPEKAQTKAAANKERGENKKRAFGNRLTRSDGQGIRDSYDFYDLILSHLLDEGYVGTQEAAERIMVNMSEGWMRSIVG